MAGSNLGVTPYWTNIPISHAEQGSQAMGAANAQTVTLTNSFTTIDSYNVVIYDNATGFFWPSNIGVVKLSATQFTLQVQGTAVSSQTIKWTVFGN